MSGEKVKQNYGASKSQYTMNLNVPNLIFFYWWHQSTPIMQEVNNRRNFIMCM